METGVIQDPPPGLMRNIVTVASIAAGIQFGWALQLSLLTPYVQTLGVPHTWATFIWLCGPISGLLVQPSVGYYSDRCFSRFGRRRPYITAGALVIILAVFLIGFAKDIGYQCGDPLDKKTKPRAVAVFVVGFWCLDVANNMLQGPCRAFLADLAAGDHKRMRIGNSWFAFFMAVGNVLGYLAGSQAKLHKLLPFTRTETCDVFCANLKTCFLFDVVLLLAVTMNAVLTVKEKPLVIKEGKHYDQEEGVSVLFMEIGSAFKTLKKPMWILLLVTCLNWIAWFPFLLFDTDWMGREVYGGNAEGTERQMKLYEMGVRAGSLGLLTNSVILGIHALGLEHLGRAMGGVHRLWGVVNFILCAGLSGTVAVSKVAERWRAVQAPQLPLPPLNVRGSAFTIFGILGIPLSVTFSVPFALASIYSSSSGAGQGLSLGVLNISIVVPQIIVSVVAGPLDSAFGGGNLPAFVMGAVAAVVSGLMAIFVLPKPPKEVSLSEVAGGH